ncbi:MAG: phosphoribosylglycinamide formyltransferase [Paludibacteraceae bacterium]|nr:phosphoribosylglycinamide formyltransferase [Paludibacteraceae bacterium]
MIKKVAIFASGSGSNAENIIRFFSDEKNVIVPFILSNKSDAFVKNRAEKLNVPFIFFTKEQWINGEILNLLKNEGIDLIVLAGFLLKVPSELIEAYPKKIVNIHPSLLPKYGGKGMYGMKVHEAVAAANEKESGITIHYVNENLDEGEIIFQAKCELLPTDSPEEIAAKVHKLEYEFFPKVIAELL